MEVMLPQAQVHAAKTVEQERVRRHRAQYDNVWHSCYAPAAFGIAITTRLLSHRSRRDTQPPDWGSQPH